MLTLTLIDFYFIVHLKCLFVWSSIHISCNIYHTGNVIHINHFSYNSTMKGYPLALTNSPEVPVHAAVNR